MHHLTTLAEYCRCINIPPPRDEHFDIRRFADNMLTVNKHQPPFRHEFYSVALRHRGRRRLRQRHHQRQRRHRSNTSRYLRENP